MSPVDENIVVRKAPWYIWLSLAAAFAIFGLASFVIYYRYVTTPETNAGIVVIGSSALEGYSIRVERISKRDEPYILTDSFNKGNGDAARFFLPSGTYRIQLLNKDLMLLKTFPDEFVPPGTRLTFDLSKAGVPTTLPTYQPS